MMLINICYSWWLCHLTTLIHRDLWGLLLSPIETLHSRAVVMTLQPRLSFCIKFQLAVCCKCLLNSQDLCCRDLWQFVSSFFLLFVFVMFMGVSFTMFWKSLGLAQHMMSLTLFWIFIWWLWSINFHLRSDAEKLSFVYHLLIIKLLV